ncbi:MAG TPA: alpha-amylase, partial [Bacteroidota bacterium]|nr:alpha-amylase [Bacteroidota bacterium]
SSKDGDWVKEHPDWYYWIKESVSDRPPGSHDESQYGNPIFSAKELENILASVENRQFHNLPPPHESYRSMFTIPPPKDSVHLQNGKYIGTTSSGTRTRIPGAFADWPPDDTQPPWKDVTYLKMYDHADFNYIAYNTIRMYDEQLATKQNINQSLWEKISEIVPHYQKQFGIDGVMIDMGHALPMELKQEMIRRARTIDSDFAFWDENFSITEKSVHEGYNAVFGYQWSDQHKIEKFKAMLRRFSEEGFALPFFATPESHNTPRAAARTGGMVYSRYAWAISNFIPATPFLHSGFELGETYPINTGLDFTKEDLKRFPSEKLPLFSEYAYDWLNSNSMIPWVRHVSSIRKKYHDLIINSAPDSFQWIETNQKDTFAFKRKSPQAKHQLILVANGDMESPVDISIPLESQKSTVEDLLGGKQFSVSHGTL